MNQTILSLLLIVIINCTFSSATNWCNIQCPSYGPHTLCRYRPNAYSPSCGRIVKGGLTAADKQKLLNLHNSLRQKVASGQEKRGSPGPQPPARNMQNLVWDDELALIAQTWANQCTFKHACSHVDRFMVGQNVGYNSNTKFENIINGWYDEVRNFNRNGVNSAAVRRTSSGIITHYTQLVWAETNKVGCGAVIYDKDYDGYNILHMVCNYGPTGNWAESMYQVA